MNIQSQSFASNLPVEDWQKARHCDISLRNATECQRDEGLGSASWARCCLGVVDYGPHIRQDLLVIDLNL